MLSPVLQEETGEEAPGQEPLPAEKNRHQWEGGQAEWEGDGAGPVGVTCMYDALRGLPSLVSVYIYPAGTLTTHFCLKSCPHCWVSHCCQFLRLVALRLLVDVLSLPLPLLLSWMQSV